MDELIEKLRDRPIPCPVCEAKLKIRISKSRLPYIVCNDCGIQMFIRYPEGIRRLINKIREASSGMF
jgi:C4-type Zn-finger protein